MRIGDLSGKLNTAALIFCLVMAIPIAAGLVFGIACNRIDLFIPAIWGIVNWLGTAAAATIILSKYENEI